MSRRRGAASVVGDALLTFAAVCGAACIALVVAALAFGVSIVLFSTGSMSPAIPAGSAAIVREVPAASVEVGDVVTVDRPGRLPITHRVVAIAGAGEERELTLRGDANPADDPAPYRVSTVRLVLFAAPGIASTIAGLGHPLVLGPLTLVASALVVWAFWPRGPRGTSTGDAERGRHSRSSHGRGTAPVVAAVGLAVLTISAPPSSAAAATTVTVVQGEVIRITSIGDASAMGSLAPGESAEWIVSVEADAPSPGIIRMSLSAAGSANPFLEVTVTACRQRPVDGGCPGESVLVPTTPLDERDGFELGSMPDTESRWFRVETRLSAPGPAAPSSSVFLLTADGFGETVASNGSSSATGGDGLARSGWDPGASASGVAAACLACAGALMLVASRRRRSS